jgi:pilus assembly protein CpaF
MSLGQWNMPPQSLGQRSRADNAANDLETLKRTVHGKLVEKLDLSRLGDLEGDTQRREIRLVIEHLCDTENPLLNRSEREKLIEEILDETFGFGPLEMLLKEPGVADIMINGPKHVFVEKEGRIQRSKVTFRDNDHLLQILDRIVSKVGRRVDETSPMVDARLPDGSRLNATERDHPATGSGWSVADDSKVRCQPAHAGRPAAFRSVHARDGHGA